MEFVIPGTLGPLLVARRTLLGNVEIYANGIKIPRQGRFRSHWSVTASDGRRYELRASGGLTTTTIKVDDHEIVVERRLAVWETALVLLPLVLILIGGLIGGLFGAATAEFNRRTARSGMRAPARIVAMLFATLVGAGLWFGTSLGIGIALAPVPEYTTGACYRGFDDAGATTPELEEVDCAAAHDVEVVGSVDISDGSYPGEDVLFGWGAAECPRLFEQYRGVPLGSTDHAMTVRYPDQDGWGRGDRKIDCFVVAEGDAVLTGSVLDASPQTPSP